MGGCRREGISKTMLSLGLPLPMRRTRDINLFFLVSSEIGASGNIWGTGLLGEGQSKGI